MSDEADKANDHTERELALAIEAARSGQEVSPTGACLFCGEEVGKGLRFCNVDCAADWDREASIRKRQGIK